MSARVTCEKCGSDDLNVQWHGAGPDHRTRQYARCRVYGEDRGKPAGEHLHYHCRRCDFDWAGPLTPAEEEDA
jgi:hypothetical protein